MLQMNNEIVEKMMKIVFAAKKDGNAVIDHLIEAYFPDLSPSEKVEIGTKIEMRLKRLG